MDHGKIWAYTLLAICTVVALSGFGLIFWGFAHGLLTTLVMAPIGGYMINKSAIQPRSNIVQALRVVTEEKKQLTK